MRLIETQTKYWSKTFIHSRITVRKKLALGEMELLL
mgnify:CR=1 FL=1|jgi:hypothetical protein